MTELFQIYYKPEQKSKIYPWATPIYNEGLTIFFENEKIKEVVDKFEGEKVGVCSWKLSSKMRKGDCLTKERIQGNYEVLSFTRNSERHRMIDMLRVWHPKSIETLDLLWAKLGYKRPNEAKHPIYQNHWVGKTEIYKDYVTNFLSPAMELTMKDEQLHNLMLSPSNYGTLSKDADLKSVKMKLGLSEFPLSPFILERCPSLWFTMKKINVTYLPSIVS